ncbi:hypothetical protein SAMD00079811_82090 (plasmid) [Scytonema sp. HK-05]|nr:hypothetical protein SAMD00079811_82090 [Scytonema sp. HK-05]
MHLVGCDCQIPCFATTKCASTNSCPILNQQLTGINRQITCIPGCAWVSNRKQAARKLTITRGTNQLHLIGSECQIPCFATTICGSTNLSPILNQQLSGINRQITRIPGCAWVSSRIQAAGKATITRGTNQLHLVGSECQIPSFATTICGSTNLSPILNQQLTGINRQITPIPGSAWVSSRKQAGGGQRIITRNTSYL